MLNNKDIEGYCLKWFRDDDHKHTFRKRFKPFKITQIFILVRKTDL